MENSLRNGGEHISYMVAHRTTGHVVQVGLRPILWHLKPLCTVEFTLDEFLSHQLKVLGMRTVPYRMQFQTPI
jgi:hypothetical protein